MALIDTSKARPLFNRRMGPLNGQAGLRVALELMRGSFSHRGPAPLDDERWVEITNGWESPPGSTAVYPAIAIV